MNSLIIIPARGGSKGIPRKNIKKLNGKPLIQYSVEFARLFSKDENICVSTDSEEIKLVVESFGLQVPFIRPDHLASDTASSRSFILHAMDFYSARSFDTVVLLQPTSPFRKLADAKKMLEMFTNEIDMVVSVKETPHANPYFSLFEENSTGFLEVSKPGAFSRRQDCPPVYAYNGSIYVINPNSIASKEFNAFNRVRKYVMDDITSLDIDTPFDWSVCEMVLDKSLWNGY